jgi:hypothetical protein
MGRKSLLLLASFAVLLVVTYAWLQREQQPAGTDREALLPALQGQLGSVTAVEVQRPGQPLVRLQRQDEAWVVPAKAGYPADGEPLVALLRGLAEAKKVEAKTANPQYHGRLGLAEQGPEEERGTLVKLERKDAQPLSLYLGNRAQQGSGLQVRLAGENQVWLIDRSLELPESELEWLDRRVAAIPFASVKELDVRYADGERLTLYRDSEQEPNLKVKQLPKDKKLPYEAAANGMATLFARLEFADAAPLAQVQFKGKPQLQFSLRTFSGGQLEGAVHQQGDQHWLTFGERGDIPAEQLPGKSDWAYRLETYQYQALAKKLKDLLAKN